MDERLVNAVLPLLNMQRRRRREICLEECVEQAYEWGARVDLVILLVRHQLPFASHGCIYGHLYVDALMSPNGGIYRDDGEALEALNLVAQALGQTLTVRLIERS